ncbi:GtrA family protein [Herbiconiux sp. VKM Ac-1786]|jgi:putative flippase GtrA|uniref:GtrA family protein n=1 Tax=Herbiconiux sp. VKM Ac-1786 TaxID=2783824 RepID=UPI00188AD016|nr:GtrA family protein [Herbiconiux sp. VKM Ac-1786]MBF4573027.1 GtrA family protein [Herbiconiux sp. VKM Ac-1786]
MSSAPASPSRLRVLFFEVVRFGMVGGLGFVVDLAVFNLLVVTVLAPAQLHEGPLIAKLISASLAIVVNWLGNRYWTFRHRRRSDMLRESIEFFVVSVLGTGIGLACLWFSHYVLGFTSLLADNISGNVIGLALGSLFRFVLYRVWVFGEHRPRAPRVTLPRVETAEQVGTTAS